MSLHAEISVRVVPKKRRIDGGKMAGEKEKNAIWALLFSLLALVTIVKFRK